ncbi:unnamed protein product [Paramecium primaurelia]|uniref:EGF-like domain-containing protein n=1 Tax=Paramecium primaurelia TaxID=5886 RepID=A0A8S1NUQ6_PARPR|nr:unnamed protein product [Paramecium primaurelia]
MPPESSIELRINETYYGKIYKNNTSLQTDNFILYANFNKANYNDNALVYQNNQYYQIYLQAILTKYFILKLIGNYTDIHAGWAIRSIEIQSGYCPSQCSICSEKFKCTKCNTNYYISKWNQCVQCTNSRLLIKEFIGLEINPVMYSEYLVISQTGSNFLKGANIFYSIFNKQRIFGGPYIWAQARFSRKFNNLDPHHSLSIAFIVVFGPSFQNNGKFIFWIDDTDIWKGFCDSTHAFIQTVNFTINQTLIKGIHQFNAYTLTGNVSIKNFIYQTLKCHPNCKKCWGDLPNQCTECFYNTIQQDNTCSNKCPPETPYFVKYQGCRTICPLDSLLFVNGYCETYNRLIYYWFGLYEFKTTEQYNWQILYDFTDLRLPIPQNFYFDNYYLLGLFKKSQGIYRILNINNPYNLTLIYIQLILFNEMPLESSIELHINNTYYGKIYKNNTSVQTDNFILYANFNKPNYYESTQVYQNNQQYQIYLQANITKQFILKLIGNYTDINAGWAIRSIEISSGYCPSQCQTCSEKFKCTKCNTNYYISKWNQCVQCTSNFQIKINDTHCQDFDTTDATKYSRLLIKEFIGLEINPVTYSEYLVISQTGLNFLKGANIYYSILNKYQRIFGGPYIWAQARFSRQFNILDPHHSLSIAFIVVFGPSFQDNGKFIFWIDDTHMTELTKSSPSNKIFKQHQHSLTTLKLDWECQGLNNEPIEAYCGFYQFYITVHYCRTGCQACTNEIDCQNPSTVLSSTCQQNNEQYDWHLDQCLKCPQLLNLHILIKLFNLQGRQSTTMLIMLLKCDRCTNDVICTQCDFVKFRILTNNQCICKEGYYDDNQNCLKCLQFCKKYTSSNDCQECIEGFSYNSNNLICERSANQYYVNCPINTLCDPCNSEKTDCKCGDGIITEMEECDDMNNLANDRCDNCKLERYTQCAKCILGVCYECATSGWYLDTQTINFICKEQCRDGKQVGTEKCDDAIESTKKICKDCQFYCYPDCLECDLNQGQCLKCREGLSSESNYYGIIVSAPDINNFEQCDDHNLSDDNDGCTFDCKFKCQIPLICDDCQNDICLHCVDVYQLNSRLNRCECRESCLECDLSQGNGCLQCKIGYELLDKQCFPICGDEIVTLDEQCDDGNLIFDNECHLCQYNCQDQCALCFKGICLEYFENYLLIQEKCIKINYEDKILSQIDLNFSYQSRITIILIFRIQQLYKSDHSLIIRITNYILDLFHQRDNLIIDYLKDKQKNIIYTTCQEIDINCSSINVFLEIEIIQNKTVSPFLEMEFQLRMNNAIIQFKIIKKHILTVNITVLLIANIVIQEYASIALKATIQIQKLILVTLYVEIKSQHLKKIVMMETILFMMVVLIVSSNVKKPVQFAKMENVYLVSNPIFMTKRKKDVLRGNNAMNQKDCITMILKIYVYNMWRLNQSGDEQCDDGNEQPNDGCNQCQFQCELLCKICIQGKCTECQEGYKIQNQVCTSTCGDGIVLLSEQCDDGNNVSRDGCTQCIIDPGYQCIKVQETSICFICQSNCANCIYMEGNIKCTSCLKGYFLLENECITCSEQCEECEKTPNNCTKCRFEKCEKCNNSQGLYADYKLRKCVPKCGDNIKARDEQCDDGNKQDKDGCTSFCEIEKGSECTRNICLKIPEKKLMLVLPTQALIIIQQQKVRLIF